MSVFRLLMGRKITARRKATRWSQEALANESGWSRQQLSRVELGQSSIATDRLLALADVLDCEVSDLIPTRAEVDAAVEQARTGAVETITEELRQRGGLPPIAISKNHVGSGYVVEARGGDNIVRFPVMDERTDTIAEAGEKAIAVGITEALLSEK
ncbi:helix-turn-helix domain-containing protein [Propionibacterium freudenreichii]|uniref:helix-turn-helix domain-containing protein n=1 Tax=Propionibacterium freudenreichii TaxID=1744 RepID=UPI0021A4D793|nr:helix-turn-helix transcriptional regulator [Propionibacterium freudenreichii]